MNVKLGVNVWVRVDSAGQQDNAQFLKPGLEVGARGIAIKLWSIGAAEPETTRVVRTASMTTNSRTGHGARQTLESFSNDFASTIAAPGLAFKNDLRRGSSAVKMVTKLAQKRSRATILDDHGRLREIETNRSVGKHVVDVRGFRRDARKCDTQW